MTEEQPPPAVDLHALVVRTALEADDDRERLRLERRRRQAEGARRRAAEQRVSARWIGATRSAKFRPLRWRRAA
ncbi:hypothetical protein [Streptomyces sp. T028]|uniref:hypothetical protein n=1 Tax=Streptomyces sp. T028 TaxID=3394379 RepID=UPI003A8356BD